MGSKGREIRLLFLIKDLKIGGIERSTIMLSKFLVDELDYVAIWTAHGVLEKLLSEDKKVEIFIRKRGLSGFFNYLVNLFELLSIIKKHRITIIHYHFRIFTLYLYVVRIIFPRIKIIYTHHNVFNDYLTKLVFADYYVAISQATRNELVQHGKKCTLVNHGVILPLEKQIKPNKKIKRIGYVGRFTQSKGLDTLLKAFKLISEINDELDLVIWGEGELKNEILTFIKVNNIADRVKLYPPSTELNNIYSSFDCLVVPSESLEGFGLVIIESMSYGVPVIVSDLLVFLETVENYKNGLIFKRGDYKDLSEKIIELTENNTLKDSLVENALQIVKKRYNFESTVVKHIKIFNK